MLLKSFSSDFLTLPSFISLCLCLSLSLLLSHFPPSPGAILRGSYSRFDHQRVPNSGASSVKSFKTILPAAAADVYYRDEIGNISTSNLRVDEDYVELELRPR